MTDLEMERLRIELAGLREGRNVDELPPVSLEEISRSLGCHARIQHEVGNLQRAQALRSIGQLVGRIGARG